MRLTERDGRHATDGIGWQTTSRIADRDGRAMSRHFVAALFYRGAEGVPEHALNWR